jgi:TetR/AcrR family transcriptional repressor of uid operon
MPKLRPDTQRARREHILDAAEICFARAGFHRCTMQDICKEASISPGALYVYFSSKEDLIAGLAERDRSEFAERFADLATAPDFIKALSALAEHYLGDVTAMKRQMCLEIGIESTRNPKVGEIFRSVDNFIVSSFEALFERLHANGRIAPTMDIPTLAKIVALIGDGLIWRRALRPDFDTQAMIPPVIKLIETLLNPTPQGSNGDERGAKS